LRSSSAEIVLKPGKDSAVRRRHHPWVYTQAVQEVRGEPGGGLLRVLGSDGAVLGWGFHSSGSLIAVRMVSFESGSPPKNWIRERISAAFRLRGSFSIDSNAYRLVNAEGDFLPGLVIDVFSGTAVLSINVRGFEELVEEIIGGLGDVLPGVKVYLKRDEHFARVEDLRLESGYLSGNGDGTEVIRESGLSFLVDFAHGQKTGFYLDQRENRRIMAAYAAGRSVLNLYSYTGGFALHAARSGARRVISVDSSASAVELCSSNAALTPSINASVLEARKADVPDYLKTAEMSGLIIADPPPFARRRSEREGALSGYLGLNQRVLSLVEPGGYVLSFSCSGAVTREDFRQLLSEAALRAGRTARFIKELGADVDHPVSTAHPEGEYLKGWLIHVA
jgi:23S rRNA (cytosine1962-C5)-methyltransferase